MKDRCYNPKDKAYKNYGERGIHICDEWLNDFKSFETWSMENGYQDNLTIDRIDVNGNYEPSNCRWVDMKTQNSNTRRNFFLWYNDKWCTVEEIAKIENISTSKAYYRYVTRKSTKLPRKQLYDVDKIRK